jgi:hypothetical protein
MWSPEPLPKTGRNPKSQMSRKKLFTSMKKIISLSAVMMIFTTFQAQTKEKTMVIPLVEGSTDSIMIALNSAIPATDWFDAEAKCSALSYGSSGANSVKFDDWRLATKEEFCAIYEYYLKNTKLFTSGVKSGAEYWTSSPHSFRAGHFYTCKIWTNGYPCMPGTISGDETYEVLPVRKK